MTEELNAKTKRRLATIERIAGISPIPNADSIASSRIRGWGVVTRVDEFQVGDICLYIEVDSFLPASDPRFEFLAKRGVRKDANDNEGYVLKTAQLRGAYSQGLAMPITLFPELADLPVGSDVTEQLNIVIWEPKIPEELIGSVKGFRPNWIPVTDEERLQNLPEILEHSDHTWIATEKIDGTSTTIYVDGHQDNEWGVCTRNYDLLDNPDVTLWKLARGLKVHTLLEETYPGERAAIQGETFGEGIQANPLRIKGRRFAAFTLLVGYREIPRSEWPEWLLKIAVPTHDLVFPSSLEEALSDVESLKSKITPDAAAEGIVWRASDVAKLSNPDERYLRASFKVISNKYLLKHDR